MSAERRDERTGGVRAASNGSAGRNTAGAGPRRTVRVRRPAPPAPPVANGNGHAHTRVVMDDREPVFDHATSHVLVADRSTNGRPLGGPTPSHLSVPTRVRLRLAHVGPWSVCKLSLLFGVLAVAAFVAALVVLYSLLDTAGVLQAIQKLVNSSGVGHHFRFDGGWLLTRLLWVAAGMVIVGSVIAVCMTALYNALADLTGGLDVTFVEEPTAVVQMPEGPTWASRLLGTRMWRQDPAEPWSDGDLPRASGL